MIDQFYVTFLQKKIKTLIYDYKAKCKNLFNQEDHVNILTYINRIF